MAGSQEVLDGGCADNWCFKIYNQVPSGNLLYMDARKACENRSMVLAPIQTENMQNKMMDTLRNQTGTTSLYFWIGGYVHGGKDKMKWLDGSEVKLSKCFTNKTYDHSHIWGAQHQHSLYVRVDANII